MLYGVSYGLENVCPCAYTGSPLAKQWGQTRGEERDTGTRCCCGAGTSARGLGGLRTSPQLGKTCPQPPSTSLRPALASFPLLAVQGAPAASSWRWDGAPGTGMGLERCHPAPRPSPASSSALREVLLGKDTVSLRAVRGSAGSPACPA